ncbi:MAG: pyruvate formate lyase family protein, partial [Desulfosarcinaceae bacterium]
MTPRIERLRQQSLEAVPSLSEERARLITEFYRSAEAAQSSIPVQRALAFKHILENKALCILPGELIVGERGPSPKATPAYPEVCLHSPEDLDLLDRRPKVPYQVDDHTREVFADIITPFWSGRSNRERILAHMSPDWKAAYEAGVFTEFQEQRSPGHTAMGDKIYRKGFLDLKQDIQAAMEGLDFFQDAEALDKLEELQAMEICADALIAFARRHADALDDLASKETDDLRLAELKEMARICRKVPAHKPDTFWEALQMYWFVHVGVITELNPWDAFNPGRLDQHLQPFYEEGLAAGALTPDFARELLQAFWIKFNNHPAPPKVGVTAKESNTYVDFALINLGGVTRNNRDGVNALSFLILDVVEEMRLLQPSSMIQVSQKNPDRFIQRALKIIRTGFGQPSVFNSEAIVQELVRQGKSMEDARQGGASGCVEAGAFGREAYFLTGYFNLPKVFEITLHNGVDPRSGHCIGLQT